MSVETDINRVFHPKRTATSLLDLYDLAQWMKHEGANFANYRVVGLTGPISEGFEITGYGKSWTLSYLERGATDVIEAFTTSNELVSFAYQKIRRDPWAWTHCVAMSESDKSINNVISVLKRLKIPHYRDSVPADKVPGRCTYRVFVFGNDRNKVSDIGKAEAD